MFDQSTRSNANKRVYVENKYRPVFSKCESATLAEGMPPGTYVTSVRAYDNDTDSAGEIFYTIVRAGAEKEFEIDPATGDIRSAKVTTSSTSRQAVHSLSLFENSRSIAMNRCAKRLSTSRSRRPIEERPLSRPSALLM